MVGSGSFNALLGVAAFLGCAWTATKVSRLAGLSSIALEVATGIVLGPGVAGLLPPQYSECPRARRLDCTPPPNFDELVDKGRPLGEALGMIANMPGVCPKDWLGNDGLHDDGDGDSGRWEDGFRASFDRDDANFSNITEYELNNTNETQWGDDADQENASDAVEAETAAATTAADAQGGSHGSAAAAGKRRLAAHRKYLAYEECLVQNCKAELARQCLEFPGFFTLVGHAGVALMIFESGMHFDRDRLSAVGPKACTIAFLGTVLPCALGTLLMVLFGSPLVPDAMAVGTTLAPTSISIAMRLLGESKALSEDFAQAIITAAFVCDILSLILFTVVLGMRGGYQVMNAVVFPCISVLFMLVGIYLAVRFWPWFINRVILSKVPTTSGGKAPTRDEVLFFIMMLVLVMYATGSYFFGTHLWGCFIAGMSFACLDKDHHPLQVWVGQTKRITSWMIRLFFAATFAFSVPVDRLLTLDAFLKGSALGIGPCVLCKAISAFFMGRSRWVIGWAMVGRAEFTYLIAQMCAVVGLMSPGSFAIVIWALLYATMLAPFAFRRVLNRYVRQHHADLVKLREAEEASSPAGRQRGQDASYQ